MIFVTFKREGHANWHFLLQVDVAGDGSETTKIKMNTTWLCNTSRFHPTSTSLHNTFYVMISLTFECEGPANWPFLLQVDAAVDGPTTKNVKINTKWLWLKTHFIPIDIWVIWLVSSVKEIFHFEPFEGQSAFWKISLCNFKFQTHVPSIIIHISNLFLAITCKFMVKEIKAASPCCPVWLESWVNVI